MNLNRFIQLVYLFFFTSVSFANPIELIELRNRTAEEIIPVIKPLLEANGAVSGQGFQLILRTSPKNLEQIRQLLEKLDTKMQQLLISVFQGNQSDLSFLEFEAATNNTRIYSTRTRSHSNPVYSLRLSNGSEGYIKTGSSEPVYSAGNWNGVLFSDTSTTYKDIQSGFYVKPQIRSDQVSMAIRPFKQSTSRMRGDAYNIQSASTTVTATPGQWIQIGAIAEQEQHLSIELSHTSSTENRSNAGIWIRADILP